MLHEFGAPAAAFSDFSSAPRQYGNSLLVERHSLRSVDPEFTGAVAMSALFNFSAWLKSRAAMTVLMGLTLTAPALAQKPAASTSSSRTPQATLRLPAAGLAG